MYVLTWSSYAKQVLPSFQLGTSLPTSGKMRTLLWLLVRHQKTTKIEVSFYSRTTKITPTIIMPKEWTHVAIKKGVKKLMNTNVCINSKEIEIKYAK